MTDVLYIGLSQMPTEGVKRALKACLETPEKIVLNGNVVEDNKY